MEYGKHVPDGHKSIWVCNDPEMEEYGEAAFGCVEGGIEYIRADIARAEITQLRAELAAERELADMLTEDDVKWIVNDNAELGVMVRGQLFFLYKGRSLQYGALDDDPTKPTKHDDGSPMKWRHVFKRLTRHPRQLVAPQQPLTSPIIHPQELLLKCQCEVRHGQQDTTPNDLPETDSAYGVIVNTNSLHQHSASS